jgi:4-amino-4-deoxy-L-arabinose transferase-like glycosyltransferase
MEWLRRNRRDLLILSLILAAATALRLTRLGYQSVWNDEALSAVIARGTTRQILTNQFHSLQPPGYYLLLHFWRGLFGDTDFALRLPSALMGIASVMVMYALGRLMFRRETGLWAAAVTALMPFHLYYSQEMRSYSALFLLASLAILCQVQLWRTERPVWWLPYLVVSLLGLSTHYLFALLLATLGLYYILRQGRTHSNLGWQGFILTYVAMGILYSPIILWLGDQWSQSQDYWIEGVSLALFLSVPHAFTVGQFLGTGLIQAGFGIVLAIVIIVMLQAGRSLRQKTAGSSYLVLVLMVYWLPIIVLYAVSVLYTPLSTPRLMMVAVPGLYLLLAWGASVPKEKVVTAILVILLISIGLIADYNWLFNPDHSKPAVREAVAVLQENALPKEAIVYANDSGFRLFYYYAPELDHRLFLENNDNPQVRPEVFRMMGGEIVDSTSELTETFWLVLHQDFAIEMQEAIFQRFEQRYTQLGYHNVGGIRMYRYQVPSEQEVMNPVFAFVQHSRRCGPALHDPPGACVLHYI